MLSRRLHTRGAAARPGPTAIRPSAGLGAPAPAWASLASLVLISAVGGTPCAADEPTAVIDLATIAADGSQLRRVLGSSGPGNFGVPVAGGRDCDGDGVEDYAVAHMTASPFGRFWAGEVDLVFGREGEGTVDTAEDSPRLLRIFGARRLDTTGNEIWIDDVNGDGLGDLLISRQNHSPDGRTGAGAFTILGGGPELAERAAEGEAIDLRVLPAGPTIVTFLGAEAGGRLGIWARTGDVDGDGHPEIAVGADQEDGTSGANSGAVYLIQGGEHLQGQVEVDLAAGGGAPLADRWLKLIPARDAQDHHFGATTQIADLDGNGRGEVLIASTIFRGGASIAPNGAVPGSSVADAGADTGLLTIVWDDNFPPAGTWPAGLVIDLEAPPGTVTSLHGGASNLHFGEEILGGLDYDGDGKADLFVGDLAARVPDGVELAGRGYVFSDAARLRGLDVGVDDEEGVPDTVILGPSAGALGSDAAVHGDFDGDGRVDLALAAPHGSPQGRTEAGIIHVLFGREGGWPATIDTAAGRLPPPQDAVVVEIHGARGADGSDLGDTLGYSAATADVNGDGLTDLVTNEMLGNGSDPAATDVGNLVILGGTVLRQAVGTPSCSPSASTLCLLDGRFEVEVDWETASGDTGIGRLVLTSDESGLFWFFNEANWELLVKVIDGCGANGHFWIFTAAATNVRYAVRITDTATGTTRIDENPQGRLAPATIDIEAFATCP